MADSPETAGPNSTKLRIWLLTNAPSPYQLEFLESLAAEPEALLDVRFMRSDFRGLELGDRIRQVGGRVLKSLGIPGINRDEFRLHPAGLSEVFQSRHDIYVLSGLYTSPTFQLCAMILTIRRKPFVLWLERPAEAMRADLSIWLKLIRFPFFLIRKLLFLWMFRISHGIVAIGSLAARQYAQLGAPKNRVFSVPYCCDLSRFQSVSSTAREEIRSQFGLQNQVVFLFSGQLVPRKGPDLLIRAFCTLRQSCSNATLILIGDGSQRAELEEMVQHLPKDAVIFTGHRNQSELPGIFAAADVFVFPSRYDGWAVVINEACAAGLPILASVAAGATHDLVKQNQNGFPIDPDANEVWVEKMQLLAGDSSLRMQFGNRSRQLSASASTENGAQQLMKILTDVAGKTQDPASGKNRPCEVPN